MTTLELNQLMYENLMMVQIVGFIALFLIIWAISWQIYAYLQKKFHNSKKRKPFFYAGTYEDFMKDNKTE